MELHSERHETGFFLFKQELLMRRAFEDRYDHVHDCIETHEIAEKGQRVFDLDFTDGVCFHKGHS